MDDLAMAEQARLAMLAAFQDAKVERLRRGLVEASAAGGGTCPKAAGRRLYASSTLGAAVAEWRAAFRELQAEYRCQQRTRPDAAAMAACRRS